MFNGYRLKSRSYDNCWSVPSYRSFSRISNWNETFNWIISAGTLFLSLLLGVGFIVDPAVPDVAGWIIISSFGICSSPALHMMMFGYRIPRSALHGISEVEQAYMNMPKKKRHKYKSYLRALYRDYDSFIVSDVTALFEHHASPRGPRESRLIYTAVTNELNAIEEGKRIYQESLSGGKNG